MREAVNGLLYRLRTGCQWRYLPGGFPPRSTTDSVFRQWHGTATGIASVTRSW
jgi:putative transposase